MYYISFAHMRQVLVLILFIFAIRQACRQTYIQTSQYEQLKLGYLKIWIMICRICHESPARAQNVLRAMGAIQAAVGAAS
jgi:hypothetical protein